ncbi:MAG: hypothetical protein Crog4KO_21100 [Crocinitomicaceae bacterium]
MSNTEKNFYIVGKYTDGGDNSAWQDTGVSIPANTSVSLKAEGAVSAIYKQDENCNYTGPGGSDPINPGALVPTLNNIAAIGKIGDGEPFLIADAQTAHSGAGGNLQLACNDSYAKDNKGGYFVHYSF